MWMRPLSTLNTPLGSVLGSRPLSLCRMKIVQPDRSFPLNRETGAPPSAAADVPTVTTVEPRTARAWRVRPRLIVVILRVGERLDRSGRARTPRARVGPRRGG